MNLTENLSLGRGYETTAGRVNWRQAHKRRGRVLERFGIHFAPKTPAAALAIPQHAMLAIARALQDEDEDTGGIVILDEPTASLPATEVAVLLDAIRDLAKQGHAIIMVTHRLDEVREVADRVTAFRDGDYVGTVDGDGLTEGDLVELILGRRLEAAESVKHSKQGLRKILEVRNLKAGPLRDVSFDLHEGEVLGIAGLMGAGRTELLQSIYGLLPEPRAARSTFEDDDVTGRSATRNCKNGMAFVPEDRHAEAVFPASSVRENMLAGHEDRYFRGGWLRDRLEVKETDADVKRFNIKTASGAAPIESLSGGNQQKVVVARWLRQSPKLLLLDEPTQGVDVGARDEIYKLIALAADEGMGVLVVSSEFEELARICGRVLVLAGGRITSEKTQPMHAHELLELSIGGTMGEVAA